MSSLEAILRVAYPKALASLVRGMGGLDEAEDRLQHAVERALLRWPEDGVPDAPVRWLVRAAKNSAIDQYRRNSLHRSFVEQVGANNALGYTLPVEEVGLRDDMLRLLFTCCHPDLPQEMQVALTLKSIGGLSLNEIARAFLSTPRAIEQRITRAKKRIRKSKLPYEIPSHNEQPERLASVLSVVHLIFNEGYSASIDGPIIRHELCRLAISQAQLLHRLFPGTPEVEGLLALLLLTHSRANARMAPDGIVSLDKQDRSLWHQEAIVEGLALLDLALRRHRAGPYQIQAAISAVHCRAKTWKDTNWEDIVNLYDILLGLTPGPSIELNRAVAISQRDGAEAGLALLAQWNNGSVLHEHHAFYSVRAGLLEELGRVDEALLQLAEARKRTTNQDEIRYLDAKTALLARAKASTFVGG